MSRPRTVLLVEDDEELRGALALVLRARELAVEEAADAAEAFRAMASDEFDAVVTDLGLPDVSGPELLRRLRDRSPSAQLVVITGQSGESLEEACRSAGADVVLTKPMSVDRLAELLAGGS